MSTDLTDLARTDRRVARELATAEAGRLASEQRIADEDAAAERRLRMQEGRLRLDDQRDQQNAARAKRRRQERKAEREAKRQRRQARRQETATWYARRIEYVRTNAASVYSGLIYGLAVAGAVYGQVDAARANGLPTPIGVVAAIAIEGTGLAMALTAQQQRLAGERALAARALIWICTAAAVAINAIGHHADPVKAVGLSFLSALGIIVYEVRSGAKHRPELRERGMLPPPPERFGWRRWLVAPRSTLTAWRLDVLDRLSPGAAALVARAEAARVERRRLAAAERERERQEALATDVRKQARTVARKAARAGETGPALTALLHLAQTGTSVPSLALPGPAHKEAEAAHEDARAARAAAAEADARAEAEATRRAQAEAETRAARQTAEAEAARRAEAVEEAERASRRAEHEAALRAAAEEAATKARAEAEQAARGRGQAEAEAQEWRRRGELAETDVANFRRKGAEQTRLQKDLEVRAATAERAAADEQQRREAAEEQLRLLMERMSPRRRRTASNAPAGEPLMFEGQPVPQVDRVSPATVLAVLEAHRDHPDAKQQDLATLAGVTDRTVRSVLSAASRRELATAGT
ncbi:DUF2637 domain-containing protein [Micromonospora sp. Llam7]|uniref:DUF2637 domain-containing protein n=1 Tax=Micromonospora tarapacensis TaxID=2835305 RepID=UPI001C82A56C|nr:DUF2637 domain-containing protein [Micromonospora tarapacensis]MBX7268959.1 DUF2637 domain-containing protein [Micromonospora tarapacensis]